MISKSLAVIALLGVGATAAHAQGDAAASSSNAPVNKIKLDYLSEEKTVGVVLRLKDVQRHDAAGDAIDNWSLAYDVDALYALDRSKSEHAKASFGAGLGGFLFNFLGERMDSQVPGHGGGGARVPYTWDIRLDGGFEAAPLITPEQDDWELQTWKAGAKVDFQVPRSIGLWSAVTRGLETCLGAFDRGYYTVYPLEAYAGLHHVYTDKPDDGDDYTRTSAGLSWILPLYAKPSLTIYLTPSAEWAGTDDDNFSYWDAELAGVLNAIPGLAELLLGLKDSPPIVTAKYANGERAPDFKNVDEWSFGIGEKLRF